MPGRGVLKLPSLGHLLASASATARRFPEVVVCAMGAGCAGVVALEPGSGDHWWALVRIASLGLPLFIAMTLAGERHRWTGTRRVLAALLGAGLLAGLYVLLDPWAQQALAQRYGHLTLTLHLAVAVVPYVTVTEPHGFWQYNRTLLFRFLLATLYAAALFIGLGLALAAVDNLLDVPVRPQHYGRLFVMIAYFFHPVFFLAGLPRDLAALEAGRDYPAPLRILAQFVMLPIVAVYVAILMLYLGRIVVTGTWPSGWTGYLVSSLAAAGILSLLLAHPERIAWERSWIDRYALAFWVAVVPAAVMVLLALWQRIGQYGITERRYLLGVLASWLGVTALHRIVTRTRDIKAIPLTLALIGALAYAGPWSAYAVAERSQAARAERILTAHGTIGEGSAGSELVEIPDADWEQVEDVVGYLVDNHGTARIEPWLVDDGSAALDTAASSAEGNGRVERILASLRVRPAAAGQPVRVVARGDRTPLEAEGFDLLIVGRETGSARGGGERLGVRVGEGGEGVVMRLGDRDVGWASLDPVVEMVERRPGSVTRFGRLWAPRASLVLDLRSEEFSARVVLRSVRLERRDGRLVATDLEVDAVLLRRAAAAP